ncbi:unnamed protein product [Nippostrongylus brasiliensis]|uniref:Alpha-2-MRAP_C domain-containing protein n=1 Tax=Nippostrongylus brasiliensis TaxID=27835 RepID=A0A0N4YM02_NIPBR|nr:unnamed protein product [Nippostrongylus brasiliensis]
MLMRCLQLCFLLLATNVVCSMKFRSEKVNYIYEKALQHIADRKRLQKLEVGVFAFQRIPSNTCDIIVKARYGELNKYDKVYMDAKSELHSRSTHEFTSQMEKIDKKLASLLEKYDLQQAVYAFREKMKHKNEAIASHNRKFPSELERFTDERLQQLWETARNGKFSEAELIALHGELKDAERKTKIYHDAVEDLNRVPLENSIHFDDHEALDVKRAQLKATHRDMSDHIDQLHQKIRNESASIFENDRVKRLWKAAQLNGNFSEKDLAIMKEELQHFDKQLRKVAFHKQELDARREERQKQGKMTLHAVEDLELEAKHEKIERKLRKMEKYLDAKARHVEL